MVSDISPSSEMPAKYEFFPTAFHRSFSNEMLKESVLWSFEWNSDDHWPSANEALLVLYERQPVGLDDWLRKEYVNIPEGGFCQSLVFEYAGSKISSDSAWAEWLCQIIEAPETEPYSRNDALKDFLKNQKFNSQADLLLRMLPKTSGYGSNEIFLRISDYVEGSNAFWNVLGQIASVEDTNSDLPTKHRGLAIAAMGSLFSRDEKTLIRIMELIELKSEDAQFYFDAFTGLASLSHCSKELLWIYQQVEKLIHERKTYGLIPLIKRFPEDGTIRDAIVSGASDYVDWPFHQQSVIEAMAENYSGYAETRRTLEALACRKDLCGEIDTMPVRQPCIQSVAIEQLMKKFPSEITFLMLCDLISSEHCRVHSVVAQCLLGSYSSKFKSFELVTQLVTDGKLGDYRFWEEIAKMATQNTLIENWLFENAEFDSEKIKCAILSSIQKKFPTSNRTRSLFHKIATDEARSWLERLWAMRGIVECFSSSLEAKEAVFSLIKSKDGICRDNAFNCIILLPLGDDEKFRIITAGLESDFREAPRSLARFFRTADTFKTLISLFNDSNPNDFNVREMICIELARGFNAYPEACNLIKRYIEEKKEISVDEEDFLQPKILQRLIALKMIDEREGIQAAKELA